MTVTSSAELVAAMQTIADGGTIRLAAGTYDAVVLTDHDFAQGITITSADPGNRAVLTDTLNIHKCSGITIEGIDLDAAQIATSANDARVHLSESRNIVVRDMLIEGHIPTASEGKDPLDITTTRLEVIAGYGLEWGLRITDCDDTTVDKVELRDLRGGISLADLNGTVLSGIEIHDVREGVNLHDVRDVTIKDSYFHDFKPWQPDDRAGDHPDMIQYWGVNSTIGVHDLTIQDSIFHQAAGGRSQTIFGALNDVPGISATNFVITGNTIINAQTNGIRLEDVDGALISGNTLLANAEGLTRQEYPSIFLLDTTNAVVTNNVLMPRWWQDGQVLPNSEADLAANNIIHSGNKVLSTTPGDADYFKIYLDAALAQAANWSSDTLGDVDISDQTGSGTIAPPPPATPIVTRPSEIPEDDERGIVKGNYLDNVLRAHKDGSYVFARNGDDRIIDGAGDDYVIGGRGADMFIFDYRRNTDTQFDVLADLDFSEGDTLRFLGSQAGTFDRSGDPDGTLMVTAGGSSVILRSLEDFTKAAASGGISYADSLGGDSLLISFEEAPDRTLEILGLTVSDLPA